MNTDKIKVEIFDRYPAIFDLTPDHTPIDASMQRLRCDSVYYPAIYQNIFPNTQKIQHYSVSLNPHLVVNIPIQGFGSIRFDQILTMIDEELNRGETIPEPSTDFKFVDVI